MREHNNGVAILGTVVFMVLFLAIAGWISDISTPKCIKTGCDNDQAKESSYCFLHMVSPGSSSYKSNYSGYSSGSSSYKNSSSNTKPSNSSGSSSYKGGSSKKSSSSGSYSSYDDGYDDVYENDDFDWDRYYNDDDYADGVDDAMDELDW